MKVQKSPSMADPLTKFAYLGLQGGKSLMGLAHKEVSTRLLQWVAPLSAPLTMPAPPEMLKELRAAMERLLEQDWQEAEAGLYPPSLLFDAPCSIGPPGTHPFGLTCL